MIRDLTDLSDADLARRERFLAHELHSCVGTRQTGKRRRASLRNRRESLEQDLTSIRIEWVRRQLDDSRTG